MGAGAEEIVRRWLDGYVLRDEGMMLPLAHPDIVVRPLRWVPDREYHGHAGVRAWIAAPRDSPIARR